jgi:hypothetical protein
MSRFLLPTKQVLYNQLSMCGTHADCLDKDENE